MPALVGEVISTIRNGGGNAVFIVYQFFNPTDGTLRDATQATSTGTKTGALIVDNMMGKTQSITVTGAGSTTKTFAIPTNGVALTVADLAANKQSNGGPITTIGDLAGLSPSLS